jgi:hypothetical protein
MMSLRRSLDNWLAKLTHYIREPWMELAIKLQPHTTAWGISQLPGFSVDTGFEHRIYISRLGPPKG